MSGKVHTETLNLSRAAWRMWLMALVAVMLLGAIAVAATGCYSEGPYTAGTPTSSSSGESANETGDSDSLWGVVDDAASLVSYQSQVLAVNELIRSGVTKIDLLTTVHTHDMLSVLSNSQTALINTAQGIEELQQASREAHAISPPESEREFHDAWVASIDSFAKSGRVLKRGIEEGKEKVIVKAFTMLSQATEDFGAASDLIAK